MATVFGTFEGVILVDFMPQGTTVNSDAYVGTLLELKSRLKRGRSNLETSKVLLQHDNSRPHTPVSKRVK